MSSQCQCCTACDGLGYTEDDDSDDEGSRIVSVTCEECAGFGSVHPCAVCEELIPVSHVVCMDCRIAGEAEDARVEQARIARDRG